MLRSFRPVRDDRRHGIDPAPRRSGPSWAAFLRSQAEAIIACDFFTVDLLDGTEAYVMAVIEHASRRIHILGATARRTYEWVTQQARNLLMDLDASGDRKHTLGRTAINRRPPRAWSRTRLTSPTCANGAAMRTRRSC